METLKDRIEYIDNFNDLFKNFFEKFKLRYRHELIKDLKSRRRLFNARII